MIKTIPLAGQVQGGASLEFLSVQVPLDLVYRVPFVLVEYSIDGEPQDVRLRLDVDKCTFADHFDGEREDVLRAAGKPIAQIVGQAYRHFIFEAVRHGQIKE
jgi:hypothetical protein